MDRIIKKFEGIDLIEINFEDLSLNEKLNYLFDKLSILESRFNDHYANSLNL